MRKKNIKIFIGLRELSGYYINLKKGFDALGIQSVFVNLCGHPFKYEDGNNPKWVKSLNRTIQKIGSRFFANLFMRIIWVGFLQNILGFYLFLWALFNFDVFIFGSNSSFFFFLDLPILKLFKKQIIYVFHGSESRPVYLNGYVIRGENLKRILLSIILTKIQKTIILIIEKFADHLISIPPQAYFHTRPFILWWAIGVPQHFDRQSFISDFRRNKNKSVRILHAPSKPGPKGTVKIREAIQSLKNKGYLIDFIEITGKPNKEVLEELKKCDFIVDELYSDTPMAVFATEAAFAGKPSIVGSYYSNYIFQDISSEIIPPSIFCHPEKIKEAIEELIINKELCCTLGEKAYNFVTSKWTSEEVARNYLLLIHNKFPNNWLYSPLNIKYLNGCGLSEEKVKKIIKKFLEKGGKNSLSLSDKPELQEMFVKFALYS